jgi:GntR family transcriptional repressor for pyruvate dehydrogenase complex
VASKDVPDSVPAYRRVADALRAEIIAGVIPPGERLPSEARLSERFGVSRGSIREALRILASERLIDTTRGATGGSTVQRLEPRDVVAQLRTSIGALVTANGCSTDEMDEVRELLEVTAAFLAAQRRSPIDLGRMRSSIPSSAQAVPIDVQRGMNLEFHYAILAATGNRLLHVFGEPVSDVIYERFRGKDHDLAYFDRMLDDHRAILAAIEGRDRLAARRAMSSHLLHIRAGTATGQPALLLDGLAFDAT